MERLDGLQWVEQSMIIYTRKNVRRVEIQKSNRRRMLTYSVAFECHHKDVIACSIENVFEFIWHSKSFFVSHVVNIRNLPKIHVHKHRLQCYTAAQAFIMYITNGFLSRR